MAAERSVDATWKPVGNLIDTITAQECQNYIKNAGYASQ